IFDTTKHNIARTPIPHVINTIPHSPPASRPYPQPDKEEAMYKRVFLALQTKNLVLNPPKCQIAAQQIDYLGHNISKDGIKPMNDKIVAILRINEPRTLKQANRFLGALGWYKKFLPNFATIAAPIHAVTNLTNNATFCIVHRVNRPHSDQIITLTAKLTNFKSYVPIASLDRDNQFLRY
ncbi:unnamed protein product, partial [Rotaria magnacalcarata]